MPEKNILHSILADKQVSQKELTKQVQKATHDELVQFASDIKKYSSASITTKKGQNQPLLHTTIYDSDGSPAVQGYLPDGSLRISIPTKQIEHTTTRVHVEESNIYSEIPLYIAKYADSLAYDFNQKIGNPLLQSDEVKQQRFNSLGKHGAKILTLVINYLGTDFEGGSHASLEHFNTIMKGYGRPGAKIDIASVGDVIYEVFKNFNDNDKGSFGLGKRYVPNIDIVDYQEYQNFTKYLYNQTQTDSYDHKKQGLLTTLEMYDDTRPSAQAKNEMQIALMDRMYRNEDGTFAPYAYQDAADGSLNRMVELKQSLLAQKTDDGSYDRTHAMGRTDVFEDRDMIRRQQSNDAVDRQISLCDQAIKAFQQVVDTPTSDVDVWSNFSKGLADGVGIPFVKSFAELYEAYDLYSVSQKPLAQQTLAERALLESVSLLSQMSQFAPRAYRVGQGLGSTMTQLPEFMVTGGVFKRGTKGATKFMQRMVRKGVTTGVEKSIVRQGVRAVAGSLAQSSLGLSHQAITIGVGRMTTKFPVTVDFHTGQVVLDEENKQLGEGFMTAMVKGFGVNWVQTLTERMGFDTGKMAKKLFGRLVTRELKTATVATQGTFEQTWSIMSKKIGEKMALTDPFGEYYEEFLSTRFSDLITSDKGMLDINSSDELDTFLICALMGVGQVGVQLTGKQIFKSADQGVQLTAQLEQMKHELLSKPNLTAQDLVLAQQTMRTNGVSVQQIAQTIVDVVKGMGVKLDNVTVPSNTTNKVITRTIATPQQQADNAALTDQLAENPTNINLIKEFAKRLKTNVKELTPIKIQGIVDAHNSPGQRGNLTMPELRVKTKILQDAGISRDWIDILFDGGYCAKKKTYKDYDDFLERASSSELKAFIKLNDIDRLKKISTYSKSISGDLQINNIIKQREIEEQQTQEIKGKAEELKLRKLEATAKDKESQAKMNEVAIQQKNQDAKNHSEYENFRLGVNKLKDFLDEVIIDTNGIVTINGQEIDATELIKLAKDESKKNELNQILEIIDRQKIVMDELHSSKSVEPLGFDWSGSGVKINDKSTFNSLREDFDRIYLQLSGKLGTKAQMESTLNSIIDNQRLIFATGKLQEQKDKNGNVIFKEVDSSSSFQDILWLNDFPKLDYNIPMFLFRTPERLKKSGNGAVEEHMVATLYDYIFDINNNLDLSNSEKLIKYIFKDYKNVDGEVKTGHQESLMNLIERYETIAANAPGLFGSYLNAEYQQTKKVKTYLTNNPPAGQKLVSDRKHRTNLNLLVGGYLDTKSNYVQKSMNSFLEGAMGGTGKPFVKILLDPSGWEGEFEKDIIASSEVEIVDKKQVIDNVAELKLNLLFIIHSHYFFKADKNIVDNAVDILDYMIKYADKLELKIKEGKEPYSETEIVTLLSLKGPGYHKTLLSLIDKSKVSKSTQDIIKSFDLVKTYSLVATNKLSKKFGQVSGFASFVSRIANNILLPEDIKYNILFKDTYRPYIVSSQINQEDGTDFEATAEFVERNIFLMEGMIDEKFEEGLKKHRDYINKKYGKLARGLRWAGGGNETLAAYRTYFDTYAYLGVLGFNPLEIDGAAVDNKSNQIISEGKISEMRDRASMLKNKMMEGYFKQFLIDPQLLKNDVKPFALLRNGQIAVFNAIVKDYKGSKIEKYNDIANEMKKRSGPLGHLTGRTRALTRKQQEAFMDGIIKIAGPSFAQKLEQQKKAQAKSIIGSGGQFMRWAVGNIPFVGNWMADRMQDAKIDEKFKKWQESEKDGLPLYNESNHLLDQGGGAAWSVVRSLISMYLAFGDIGDDDENLPQAIAFGMFRSLIPVMIAELLVQIMSDEGSKSSGDNGNPRVESKPSGGSKKPNSPL